MKVETNFAPDTNVKPEMAGNLANNLSATAIPMMDKAHKDFFKGAIILALGALAADNFGTAENGPALRQGWAAATKAAMREAGVHRQTAQEWVVASAGIAPKFGVRFEQEIAQASVVGWPNVIQTIMAVLSAANVVSVAGLRRFLKGETIDPNFDDKEAKRAEKAAKAEALAKTFAETKGKAIDLDDVTPPVALDKAPTAPVSKATELDMMLDQIDALTDRDALEKLADAIRLRMDALDTQSKVA